MDKYKNRSGMSGIDFYKIGKDFILIRFTDNASVYKYSYALTGKKHVENMKKLAVAGNGLSTYIAEHPEVKNNFEKL